MQKIYWTRINQVIDEAADIRTFLLDCPVGFTWQEGARTHLGLPGFNAGVQPDRQLVRHMSIATAPGEAAIAITTRLPDPASEFKQRLARQGIVGGQVALFKTASHVPLERNGRKIYLLSQGTGLAALRPHVIEYLRDPWQIEGMHSLTVSSPGEVLFADVFRSRLDKAFTARQVHHRHAFQAEAQALAGDENGLFYIIGSYAFLVQTTQLLMAQGVDESRIRIDKHAHELPVFFDAMNAAALLAS